jgi:hypothetical protein
MTPDRSSPFVTVVSGLPRSGTSLMMQMLAAGGMPLLTDGQRQPDSDNPRGYYEFEPAKRLHRDSSWVSMALGKAVKIVYVHLPYLPARHDYRILFMDRALEQVIASQRAMVRRSGPLANPLSDERLEAMYRDKLRKLDSWLSSQSNILVTRVRYRDLIDAPEQSAAAVATFLGCQLNVSAMAGVVDPTLCHQGRNSA